MVRAAADPVACTGHNVCRLWQATRPLILEESTPIQLARSHLFGPWRALTVVAFQQRGLAKQLQLCRCLCCQETAQRDDNAQNSGEIHLYKCADSRHKNALSRSAIISTLSWESMATRRRRSSSEDSLELDAKQKPPSNVSFEMLNSKKTLLLGIV